MSAAARPLTVSLVCHLIASVTFVDDDDIRGDGDACKSFLVSQSSRWNCSNELGVFETGGRINQAEFCAKTPVNAN
ncbi:hypothetical protein M513_01990, partial [Trichuris suis]